MNTPNTEKLRQFITALDRSGLQEPKSGGHIALVDTLIVVAESFDTVLTELQGHDNLIEMLVAQGISDRDEAAKSEDFDRDAAVSEEYEGATDGCAQAETDAEEIADVLAEHTPTGEPERITLGTATYARDANVWISGNGIFYDHGPMAQALNTISAQKKVIADWSERLDHHLGQEDLMQHERKVWTDDLEKAEAERDRRGALLDCAVADLEAEQERAKAAEKERDQARRIAEGLTDRLNEVGEYKAKSDAIQEATAKLETAEGQIAAALRISDATLELNMANYSDDEVQDLNDAVGGIFAALTDTEVAKAYNATQQAIGRAAGNTEGYERCREQAMEVTSVLGAIRSRAAIRDMVDPEATPDHIEHGEMRASEEEPNS